VAVYIRQRQADVITGHDAPQGNRDGLEELPKVQLRDDAVVHLQQQQSTCFSFSQRK
jgi:hypothetical protein